QRVGKNGRSGLAGGARGGAGRRGPEVLRARRPFPAAGGGPCPALRGAREIDPDGRDVQPPDRKLPGRASGGGAGRGWRERTRDPRPGCCTPRLDGSPPGAFEDLIAVSYVGS